MNFLELVQRTRREVGISGSGPSTVIGQTGEMLRLVEWVRTAYIEIQNFRPQWGWLNKSATIDLLAGGQTYHPVTNLGIYPLVYDLESFRLYATALGPVDTQFLHAEDYSQAKRRYLVPTAGRPTAFMIRPTRDIQFNRVLDQDYSFSLDYYATAEELTQDADVPSLPEQYQLAIVWKAVQHYGRYEEVPFLVQTGEINYTRILEQMLATESPKMHLAGPLA